jgi:hypothetical protein
MSSLKHIERIKLEKLLGMSSGYVCDFSDRTFRDFVLEATDIDIYKPGYEGGGTSKANRLRTFWEKESDQLSGKLIYALLDYWKTQKLISNQDILPSEAMLCEECLKIADRLSGELLPTATEDRFSKLKNKISEIEGLKYATPWGGDYKIWNNIVEKEVEKNFGRGGLNLFRQQISVVLDTDGYIYELTEKKKILEKLIQNKDDYKPSASSNHDGILYEKLPTSGLIIGAAGDIRGAGEILAHKDQIVSLKSLKNIEHSGKIKVTGTSVEKNLFERLTNNQTFASIAGTLIVLIILYVIYYYFGINLSKF